MLKNIGCECEYTGLRAFFWGGGVVSINKHDEYISSW